MFLGVKWIYVFRYWIVITIVVHFTIFKSYIVILFLILINQLTIQNCITEKIFRRASHMG